MADPIEAFVAVGSNIDPRHNLPEALRLLKGFVRVTAASAVYRTAPLGGRDQDHFLNGVWRVETSRPARALKFHVLREIEARLGRVRTDDPCAPRTIDLDLLLYGDAVIDEPDLRVPDPDIRARPFLAAALLELAPELVLPDTHERLAAAAPTAPAGRLEAVTDLTQSLRRSLSQ